MPYFGQSLYTLANQCANGNCEATSVSCSMPQLFIGDRWVTRMKYFLFFLLNLFFPENQVGTIGNRQCTIYTPAPCYADLNPCLSTLYMSGNTLCGAQFVDESFFVVNTIDTSANVPPLSRFLSSGTNCTCGRAVDIVVGKFTKFRKKQKITKKK